MSQVVHAKEIINLVSNKSYTLDELRLELSNKFGENCKFEDMFGVLHDFNGVISVMKERGKISIKDDLVHFLGCSGKCPTKN